MSFYQRYGAFDMFGAFGGGAPELFPGGPAFVGGSDQGVFYGSDTSFTQGAKNQGFTWTPAAVSWQKAASEKWLALTGPNASMADSDFHDSMQQKLSTLLNSFYIAVGNHSILGYSGDATQQIINTGNQLKAAVRELIAYQPRPDPSNTVSQTVPETGSRPLLPSVSSVSKQSVEYPSTTSGATDPNAPAASNTMLYVAVGAGALVLIGGVLALTRKRAAATAGYRRRRR